MSRATIAATRLVLTVVSLLLIAFGAGLIVWWAIAERHLSVSGIGSTAHTTRVQDVLTSSWWPWAAGAAGVLLVLLGVRWLLSHIPRSHVSQLRLPGSQGTARLTADVKPAVDSAAQLLADVRGIDSAKGVVRNERGQLVVRLNASAEPRADLTEIAHAAEGVGRDLRQVLGRDDVHYSVVLNVVRRAKGMRSVR